MICVSLTAGRFVCGVFGTMSDYVCIICMRLSTDPFPQKALVESSQGLSVHPRVTLEFYSSLVLINQLLKRV